MEAKPEIIAWLRRVGGQVAGVRRMYEESRNCIDILDQLAAARAGLEAAALLILEDHVHGCVKSALADGGDEAKTAELVSAVRRYVKSV